MTTDAVTDAMRHLLANRGFRFENIQELPWNTLKGVCKNNCKIYKSPSDDWSFSNNSEHYLYTI